MNPLHYKSVIPKMTVIGRLMAPELHDPKYRVKRDTLKLTCNDPQIWEAECIDGTILYIRFKGGNLNCKVKKTGEFVCSGNPFLDREKIPDNRIEFYLEMYSNHNIYFQ